MTNNPLTIARCFTLLFLGAAFYASGEVSLALLTFVLSLFEVWR